MRIDEVIDELKWLKGRTNQEKTLTAIDEAVKHLSTMPITNLEAEYKALNGYRGKMYGKSSLAIYNKQGNMIFHTGFRTPNTFNELKEHTDTFDDFLKIMTEERS
jgi:hypothetical protein